MTPLDPQSPATSAIIAAYVNGYTKGRQDFVATVVSSLSEPAFAKMTMTPAHFANILKQASEKCDQVPTPKSLTN